MFLFLASVSGFLLRIGLPLFWYRLQTTRCGMLLLKVDVGSFPNIFFLQRSALIRRKSTKKHEEGVSSLKQESGMWAGLWKFWKFISKGSEDIWRLNPSSDYNSTFPLEQENIKIYLCAGDPSLGGQNNIVPKKLSCLETLSSSRQEH